MADNQLKEAKWKNYQTYLLSNKGADGKTIRSIKELQRFNPIDLNEPFPEKIFPLVENNFRELQKKYEKLKKAKFGELNK
jgi:hypothetical protein